ncbi:MULTISPECIES: hypothetical protein [unclassified Microcoleus]|uniref:hypothetical protein n=1 Tax=unclassified Microcoleus TaxID=2642155 RepID=UPI002FD23D22
MFILLYKWASNVDRQRKTVIKSKQPTKFADYEQFSAPLKTFTLARNAANCSPRQLHRDWIGAIFSLGFHAITNNPQHPGAFQRIFAGDIQAFWCRSGNGSFSSLLYRVSTATIFAQPD